MKKPPDEWMLLTNLMFRNVVCTHDSLRVSGSENSNGPEKLPFVQSVKIAPTKPSKIDPWEKLRFRSTPQLLRAAGSVSLFGNRVVSSQWLDRFVRRFASYSECAAPSP